MVGVPAKWSGGGETVGTEPERNAATEPQTEARRLAAECPCPLVTNARIGEVELGGVEGRYGDGQARGAKHTARWSRRFGFRCTDKADWQTCLNRLNFG